LDSSPTAYAKWRLEIPRPQTLGNRYLLNQQLITAFKFQLGNYPSIAYFAENDDEIFVICYLWSDPSGVTPLIPPAGNGVPVAPASGISLGNYDGWIVSGLVSEAVVLLPPISIPG